MSLFEAILLVRPPTLWCHQLPTNQLFNGEVEWMAMTMMWSQVLEGTSREVESALEYAAEAGWTEYGVALVRDAVANHNSAIRYARASGSEPVIGYLGAYDINTLLPEREPVAA